MSATAPVVAGDHSGDDTAFAQTMIPHHAQAVQMSEMILSKRDIPAEVTAQATRIKDAQGPEIIKMTTWLQNWNEPASMTADHTMPGMSGEADLATLEAAQGVDAAKLFLTQMIAHHQGAITMAEKETAAGKNPEAVALAGSIVASQETEIQKMQKLLAGL
ncbi:MULTISPECIES: DUF305 domain-containing protein [Paenarthrobacter]|uniref:DUF305 domain-containing protein n=1 Tax=Paenarthrobacter TaxID=1742992 RepID=UPI0029F49B9E|nr:DUF305 domain-containing protein [Paenarthrobacter sp. PAE-2]